LLCVFLKHLGKTYSSLFSHHLLRVLFQAIFLPSWPIFSHLPNTQFKAHISMVLCSFLLPYVLFLFIKYKSSGWDMIYPRGHVIYNIYGLHEYRWIQYNTKVMWRCLI
jgi:hypothetical protein